MKPTDNKDKSSEYQVTEQETSSEVTGGTANQVVDTLNNNIKWGITGHHTP